MPFFHVERAVFLATVVLVCGGCISELLAASVPVNEPAAPRAQTPFTFDDIFDPKYRAKGFGGSWINNTHFLYLDDNGNIQYFNAETKVRTIFVENTTFMEIGAAAYYVSAHQDYVLFSYALTPLWRHSYSGKYAAYNVATKVWSFLPSGGNPKQNETLQYCNWSPSGNALAFVYNNDLYYQSTPDTAAERITTNGDPMYLFNGVPDWLYEEDVLASRVTHYWSPTSQFIVYAELNDTEVPLQSWPVYGHKSQVYPQVRQVAYPKAGDVRDDGATAGSNTKVKLFVVDTSDLTNTQKKQLLPPSALRNEDHYYLQVAWRNNKTVMVTWANRVQNQSFTYIYNASESGDSLAGNENHHLIVYDGWVEVPPATPLFINDGADYITVISHNVTDDDPWRNIARISAPDSGAGSVTFLMKSEQEVEYIVGHNSSKVYFVSTNGNPLERHIMSVDVNGDETQTPHCLTCNEPESCRYMSGSFSPDGAKYYFLNCHGPDIPTYSLRNIQDAADVYVFEDNQELKANLELKLLPTREFNLEVPLADGHVGRAEIFRPPGHIQGNKYPLLVYAYAGPSSQRVMKSFPMGGTTSNWLTFLKSSHNVVVASIDGRGSMAAGDKTKFKIYRNLSNVEIRDQIAGGNYFRSLDEIDGTIPSAIFGWSYGGGVAAHVIGDTSTTFTCGISVAPVTTKAYYDTAYTERYLGLATNGDNKAGYDKTDVMNKAANFVNKTFMIAHGTADDNVHFMHHVQLVSALSNAGVKFRQNLYADQNHGINSPGQERHLYASMTDLLLNDCWRDVQHPSDGEASGAAALKVLSPSYGFALLLLALLTFASTCHLTLVGGRSL